VKIKKRHSFNPAYTASLWVIPTIFVGMHLMLKTGGINEWMIWASVPFAFASWVVFNWKLSN
jgi:hypothetical protein